MVTVDQEVVHHCTVVVVEVRVNWCRSCLLLESEVVHLDRMAVVVHVVEREIVVESVMDLVMLVVAVVNQVVVDLELSR